MQNVHPTMRAFLAPFAPPSYYTLHPAERLEDLEYSFCRALEAGQPLPTKVIGADLDSLICEQIAQVEKVLRWAAQHRAAHPELRALLQPLAQAWAREVESCK